MKSNKRTTTMTSTIKNLILAPVALAAAVTAFVSPALAGEAPEGFPTVEVQTAGYDLSTPRGVASVTRKARIAAMQVCHVNEERDLGLRIAANQCFKKTVADATRQIEALRQVRSAGRSGEQVAVVDTSKLPVTK
jgi:UrcA family protein